MQQQLNPYTPGAGRLPRPLTGRDRELELAHTMAARVAAGMDARGVMLKGLRGVGKTVLLNRMRQILDAAGWVTLHIEIQNTPGGAHRVRLRIAEQLQTLSAANHKAANALKGLAESIQAFSVGSVFSFQLRDASTPTVDSLADLSVLVRRIIASTTDAGTGVAFFVDELQDADEDLLGALLSCQQELHADGLPFVVNGAGLPSLPSVLSLARSYSERQFEFREIGPLDPETTGTAFSAPAIAAGGRITSPALTALISASAGYPFFIQEFGYYAWEHARNGMIDIDAAQQGITEGFRTLDTGFFEARWARATKSEREYLKAMSTDNGVPSESAEIARRLGKRPRDIGARRSALINKGIIFVPQHGQVAYTVPGMAEYISRRIDA